MGVLDSSYIYRHWFFAPIYITENIWKSKNNADTDNRVSDEDVYAEKMKAHKCKQWRPSSRQVQMVKTESTQVQMMTTWQKTSIGDDDMDADEGKWI